ncbi:MAG: hypothetical protein GPJ51_04470 [Candidatus Heimdallarchaeota archaeon]|nr:hypothetical protein [Candidatus Heimdallarchaeota archaeon]
MVISEKDLLAKAPIIKKPKTLNPFGAIILAALLGGGQALIRNSFVKHRIHVGLGVLGIILIIISIFFLYVAVSLSAKTALFTTKIEPSKTIYAQIALQIMFFYIGFLPIYGFSIVYFDKTLALWKILSIAFSILIFFAAILYLNVKIMQKDEAKLGDLKKPFYQPKKLVIIVLSSFIPIIATLVVSLI